MNACTALARSALTRLSMRSWVRSPALHFIAIGAALYLASVITAPPPRLERDTTPIVISESEIASLLQDWQDKFGTAPAATQRAELVQAAIDDEILYREALALQLDRRSPTIADRLQRIGSFVSENELEDPGRIEAEARRLGLERNDVVVRRHLIQLMRLILSSTTAHDAISDEAIAEYYEAHRLALVQPATLTFKHLFLRRQHAAQAGDMLIALNASGGTELAGDPFIRGAHIGPTSWDELERSFGPQFAADLRHAPLARWSGPFESAYGTHLVWVAARSAGEMPALAAVRSRIIHEHRQEARGERLNQQLARLRQIYSANQH